MNSQKWTEDALGMLVEAQGPYDPEQLNSGGVDDVFSRRFRSAKQWVDVYAAPVKCEASCCADKDDDDPEKEWDVLEITEVRDAWDHDGGTSNYEYEYVGYVVMTYEEAVEVARGRIEALSAEDFG